MGWHCYSCPTNSLEVRIIQRSITCDQCVDVEVRMYKREERAEDFLVDFISVTNAILAESGDSFLLKIAE